MRGFARRTIVIWSAVTVALALLIAGLPLVLFPDAGANDGAGPMTAIFGIPMVATAVLIHLALLRRDEGRLVSRMLPWVLGIVFGIVVLAIPAALTDRAYYEAETLPGMLATLAGFAVIALLGAGCGVVLWFVLLTPVASLVLGIAEAWRGEVVRRSSIVVPAIVLAVEIAIVVLVIALNVEEPQDLVVVQIVGALFGIAGLYPEVSPVGLWIVRALLVAVAVTGVVLTVSRRPAEEISA